MRKLVQWPAWLPDQLPREGMLIEATNVLPAANGYRPARSVGAISNALSATFKGGGAFISTGGTAYLLAGTSNGLQRLTAGTWSTLLTAMTVDGRWRFAQFGDHVVAVNGTDTKVVDLNTGTAADLAAPAGRDVAVVGDQVVITGADGNVLKVAWSAFNDHTGWTPGVNQSGFQPMLTGGELKGIAGGEYGVLLQRFRLVRMDRTGDASAPFSFSEITPNFGCASSGSIAQAGRTVFFLSDRGFMALDDGQALRPIGNEKFDQHFRNTVSPDDYEKLWAAVDPKRSLVMWGYPGLVGIIWVYNWVLDRASVMEVPFAGLFPGYSTSETLESVSAAYPDLDTMPYSLDDPRFAGGDPRLYVVTRANEIGAFTGPTLEGRLKQGWWAPVDPLNARVRAVWPEGDAAEGVTVTVDARQRMGVMEGAVSSAAMQQSGRAPLRTKGRYLSTSVTHAAGSVWSYDQGFSLDFEPGGLRG